MTRCERSWATYSSVDILVVVEVDEDGGYFVI